MSSNTCVSPAAVAAPVAAPFLGDAFQSRIQRLAENVKCGNRKSLPDSHKDSKRLPAWRIAGESALINKRAKRDRGTCGITSLLMEVILSFPKRTVGLRGLTHTTGGDRGIPGLRENHPRLRIGTWLTQASKTPGSSETTYNSGPTNLEPARPGTST